MIVSGFPSAGMRNSLTDCLRHRVAADIGILEHEGVTRVVADCFDAGNQFVIVHARRSVLELTHPLVDHRNQVREPIRNRSIDRITDALPSVIFGRSARPLQSGMGIARLSEGNDFGKNIDFFL